MTTKTQITQMKNTAAAYADACAAATAYDAALAAALAADTATADAAHERKTVIETK